MYATHVLENNNNCLNQPGFNAADKLMIGRERTFLITLFEPVHEILVLIKIA